jgi:hypothetical protein
VNLLDNVAEQNESPSKF